MSEGLDAVFREEARELLVELEQALLELEAGGEDAGQVERVFRALHTIKGAGGMAGFDAVSEFTHEVETAFEMVRGGRLAVSRELVSLTLEAQDLISAMIETPDGDLDELGTDRILTSLRGLLPGGCETPEGEAERAPATPDAAGRYRIAFRPPRDIFLRGINPLSFLKELSSLGDCQATARLEDLPPLEELDPEACYLRWDILLKTEADENAIRDVFIFIEDDCELHIEPVQTSPPTAAKASPETGFRQKKGTDEAASSVRVRSEKLDSLVNLIGELVTVQARFSQIAANRGDAELTAVAENVELLTSELRDQVLNIRMLPIGTTFSRFRRLVRDLSNELGKDVELITEGGETELDKTVMERLGEPLVHLIRNCIDHGIEGPDLRAGAGKPARGTVRLAARQSGGNVMITVSDDGAGLDPEAVRAKAVAMGLIAEEAGLSEKEAFGLIFHPGLSTVSRVTSVSGRGVGMDVVKGVIDELRGAVDVASSPGQGTSFTLKLPLTLAIINGLLVKIGGDFFVFPLAAVEECIELKQADVDKAHDRHLVNVRGEILPYIRLRQQFDTGGVPPEIQQIVITECEGQRVGFVVDEVVGEHQTVIKALGRMYRDVRGLSGATVLGDGSVALILDLPQLLQIEESLACQG